MLSVDPYPNPFNAELELASAIVSTLAFVLLFAMTTWHYKRKRSKASLYLWLIIVCYFLMFLMRTISLIGWAVEGEHKNDLYRYGLALSYGFLQCSNLFLLLFSDRIFNQLSSRRVGKWIALGFAAFTVVLFVLLMDIPGNNYGEYDGTRRLPILRIVTHGAILFSSAILFVYMIVRFAFLSRKATDPREKRLVQYIILSYSCQLLTLAFVIIDALQNAPAPTIFLVLMHASSVFAAVFLYLGLLVHQPGK